MDPMGYGLHRFYGKNVATQLHVKSDVNSAGALEDAKRKSTHASSPPKMT